MVAIMIGEIRLFKTPFYGRHASSVPALLVATPIQLSTATVAFFAPCAAAGQLLDHRQRTARSEEVKKEPCKIMEN
jgi:hypothetical protein